MFDKFAGCWIKGLMWIVTIAAVVFFLKGHATAGLVTAYIGISINVTIWAVIWWRSK